MRVFSIGERRYMLSCYLIKTGLICLKIKTERANNIRYLYNSYTTKFFLIFAPGTPWQPSQSEIFIITLTNFFFLIFTPDTQWLPIKNLSNRMRTEMAFASAGTSGLPAVSRPPVWWSH